jgi:hypothetical protein
MWKDPFPGWTFASLNEVIDGLCEVMIAVAKMPGVILQCAVAVHKAGTTPGNEEAASTVTSSAISVSPTALICGLNSK